MNILYVSPFSHGVNVSPILNIAHLIANEGHNVHFYTVKTSYIEFKGDESLEMAELPDNVQMHYIKNRFVVPSVAYPFINPIKEYKDLKKIIQKNDIDLVHFNFPEHLICLPLLKRSGIIPAVLSINGIPGYDWFYGIKSIDFIGKMYSKFISSRAIKQADAIVPLSSNLSDTLLSLDLCDNNSIFNVTSYGGSYGVDTELFKPCDPDKKMELREKYGLPSNSIIIIYAGRFVKVKRLDKLIKLFNKLKLELDDVFLLMVGDGPEKGNLINLTSNSQDTKFMGFVNQQTLSELYSTSDIFVLLSSGEGNPGSLMEACSSGLPALVTNVGANEKIVHEGINGFILREVNDSNSIIDKISSITKNYEKFSKNSRQIAVKELSWDSIVKNHIKLYNNLVMVNK